MKDFPKWMLALAGTNLLPFLASPLFMFGAFHPFGTSEIGVFNFLLYLLTNALWVIPFLLFFASLHLYRNCYEKPGVIVAALGLLITIVDIVLLLVM